MSTHIRSASRTTFRCILPALLLCVCSIASAATHCVNTSAELANAIDTFVADDEDTVIHIAQGSYVLNERPYQLGSDLTLIGGYSDGSCNGRAYDPSLTVLNPGASGSAFELGAEDATLASLTLRGFGNGVTVQVTGDAFFDGELRVSRVRFEGNRFNILDSDDTTIIEVVAQGSTGITSSASNIGENCALFVDGDDNSILSILHSTIANNAANGLCVFGRDDVDGLAAVIENSIIYGNNTAGDPTFVDVFISGTQNYELRNNHIPSFSGFPAPDDPGASSGNSDADPFFMNLTGNDFRLQLGSSAIDSGAPNVYGSLPQLDIVGNPRFVGSAPDRGAYESSFDGTEELVVVDPADTNTPGTLRWALTQANVNQGYSVIRFNMPGACPRAIDLGSPLPQIVSAVGIDGYSQPGSHPNTRQPGLGNDANICVLLRGGAGAVANGLHIPTAAGSVGYLQMSGLAFGGFGSAAVRIEAGVASILYGNQIGGTLADGAVFAGQQPFGIVVAGSAEHTQIGGPDPWQMNLISDTTNYAIALNAFSEESIVENNFIGVGPSGNAVLPNNFGIGISANDNLVRGNAISGSAGAAIFITGHRNNIWLNELGRRVGLFICPIGSTNCDPDLFNTSHGVLIQGTASDNIVQANIIAKSGGAGIRATSGQRNSFIANRIRDSGEWSIDLGALGPNGINNDTAPGEATLANRGINAPFLIGARGGRLQGSATGTLTTTNGNYLLQAFAGRCINNRAQPEQLVGLTSVTISDSVPGQNGAVAFDMTLRSQSPPAPLPGRFISVMATEILPNGDATHSSELSACRGYLASDELFADGFE